MDEKALTLDLQLARAQLEIEPLAIELHIFDRVLVRELRLHGATGELTGNAELTPQTLSVTAQGQNLDLSAFSRVLGLPRGVLEGRASLSIDALSTNKTQRGSLELTASKATISGISDISGQLSAKLDGRNLTVNEAKPREERGNDRGGERRSGGGGGFRSYGGGGGGRR